jgi:hypothetical protein
MNKLRKSARLVALPAIVLTWASIFFLCEVHSAEQSATEKRFVLDVRQCTGDPDGSVKAKSVTAVSWPRMLFENGKPAEIQVGGAVDIAGKEIPFGKILHAETKRLNDGKVLLNFSYEESSAATDANKSGDQIASFEIAKVIGSVTLQPGTVSKFHRSGAGRQQTWLEITLTEN